MIVFRGLSYQIPVARVQERRSTTFGAATHNICGPSVWKLLVTLNGVENFEMAP
jgi:hypothetical protein